MKLNKLLIIISILIISAVSCLFLIKTNKTNGDVSKIEENLSYNDFAYIQQNLFSELGKINKTIDINSDVPNVSITGYFGNKDKMWSEDTNDLIDNNLTFPKKFKKYYINESSSIVTLVEIQYVPSLNSREYLSSKVISSPSDFDGVYALPVMSTVSFTDKGLYFELTSIALESNINNSESSDTADELMSVLNKITNDVQTILLDK